MGLGREGRVDGRKERRADLDVLDSERGFDDLVVVWVLLRTRKPKKVWGQKPPTGGRFRKV